MLEFRNIISANVRWLELNILNSFFFVYWEVSTMQGFTLSPSQENGSRAGDWHCFCMWCDRQEDGMG